ncbi:MAG: hypothetical protein ACRD50_16965 [Candidatus Acidiferrales bacterium]
MNEARRRPSGGITAAAIVEFLGSGLTILMGLLMFAGMLMFQHPPAGSELPLSPFPLKFMIPFFIVLAAIYFALASLGIATGVGLLRLRGWARISTIVFSLLLLLFTVPAGIMMLFIQLPETPGTPPGLAGVVRGFMAAINFIPAAIGVWWLTYFNLTRAKMQFQSVAVASIPEGTEAIVLTPTTPARSARPLSISVIAWFMIVGSIFALPSAFLKLPAFVFNATLTGWQATAYYLAVGACNAALGIGLLRLRSLARTLSIAYYLFATFVVGFRFLTPGFEARTAVMRAAMHFPQTPSSNLPAGFEASLRWIAFPSALLINGLIIWFLVKAKKSFEAEAKSREFSGE